MRCKPVSRRSGRGYDRVVSADGNVPTEADRPEPRPAESPLRPGETIGGYVIEAVAGRGGMGLVYRARDPELGRPVALKVIAPGAADDAGFRRRFEREWRLAAALEHPNVVPVYRAGQEHGRLFLAMRFIEGETLAELVQRRGRLEPDLAMRFAEQVATALDAAHSCGVVHRDVKPGNVLIGGANGEQVAYLADFGVAKLLGGEALTQAGRAVGTLAYMAPEVLRGEPADGRTDIYALGCVLFEALTGAVPYPRETEAAVLSAHLIEPVPSLRDRAAAVGADVDALVQWMLAKWPEERPQHASEVTAALRAARSRPSSPQPPSVDLALRSAGSPVGTNLPRAPRALIGRERDLRDLVEVLRAGESRLISLTGPAGVGKTELALTAAQSLAGRFVDGVSWVELESVSAAAEVPAAIAQALRLHDEPGVSPLERVIEHLRERRMLLVLDNFEQVVDAATDLVRIIESAPHAHVLVTSQARLRVHSEHTIELSPLELPDGTRQTPPELLADIPAVALLIERARSDAPNFSITADNAAATAALCRRLDGLPLALELAAARLALLGPAELLTRVEKSLDALGRGGRDLPARHRGLRAALEWTTRQLPATERALLARLAVFAGGFSIDLAEAVAERDVLDGLDELKTVSLLRRDRQGRLSMPPPVRAYALGRLRDTGDERAARGRHAGAMLALAEQLGGTYRNLAAALRMMRDEWENLRQALRWAAEHDPTCHARLIAAGGALLTVTGHERELAIHVDLALGRTHDSQLRASLLVHRAYALEGTGDTEPFQVAIEACRTAGNTLGQVDALSGLSNLHAEHGRGEPALQAAREARALAEHTDDRTYVDVAELVEGQALATAGRVDEGLTLLQAVSARAPAGSHAAIFAPALLADAALYAGDATRALEGYCLSLRGIRGLGTPPNDALQLDGTAMALAALGSHEHAVIVAAISDQVRHEFSCRVAPGWHAKREAALAPSRRALDPEASRRYAEGLLSLGLERAITWVIELAPRSRTVA
jgi:serine/threonine protein kinase/predicted ATPase